MGHPDHLCLTPQGSPSDSHGDPPPEASPSQTSVTPLYTLQMVFFKPQNHSFGSIGLEKIETYEEIKSDRYAERHPGVSLPDTLRDTQACTQTHKYPHPHCSHRHSWKIRDTLSARGPFGNAKTRSQIHTHKRADSGSRRLKEQTIQSHTDTCTYERAETPISKQILWTRGHEDTDVCKAAIGLQTQDPLGLAPGADPRSPPEAAPLSLDINNLTPVEALNKLNDIKKIVGGK